MAKKKTTQPRPVEDIAAAAPTGQIQPADGAAADDTAKPARKKKEPIVRTQVQLRQRPIAYDFKKVSLVNFELRQLCDSYDQALKLHNADANRLRQRRTGVDDTDPAVQRLRSAQGLRIQDVLLAHYRAEIYNYACEHPAYYWGMGIKGINLILLCKLIGSIPMSGPLCVACGTPVEERQQQHICWSCREIKPTSFEIGKKCGNILDELDEEGKPAKCKRPVSKSARVQVCPNCGNLQHDHFDFSDLRTFSGHTPGKNKYIKKQAAIFSRRLKTYCYQAFCCLLKCGGKPKEGDPARSFVEIYNMWRVRYAERCGVGPTGRAWLARKGEDAARFGEYSEFREVIDEDNSTKKTVPVFSDSRQHLMAKTKVVDVALSHLWLAWRRAMGWGYNDFYAHRVLGHLSRYQVDDFSSGILAEKKDRQAHAWAKGQEKHLAEFFANIEDPVTGDSVNDPWTPGRPLLDHFRLAAAEEQWAKFFKDQVGLGEAGLEMTKMTAAQYMQIGQPEQVIALLYGALKSGKPAAWIEHVLVAASEAPYVTDPKWIDPPK